MPLHQWSNLKDGDGAHDIWLVERLRYIKPQLPLGYRAHIGSSPILSIDAARERPDVAVRSWGANNGDAGESPAAQDAYLA